MSRAGGTKTGGRKKGTPNKVTATLRERITAFSEENFDEAVEEWRKIKDPKDKVKTYTELLKYALPTLQSVEFKGEAIVTDVVAERLKKLSEETD